MTAEARCYVAGCEDGGRGHQQRNAGAAALEVVKSKIMDSALEPLKGMWPCRHLDLGPGKLILDF